MVLKVWVRVEGCVSVGKEAMMAVEGSWVSRVLVRVERLVALRARRATA